MQLVDFILHVDKYLGAFVTQYGPWVYALLFIIVFVETGVVKDQARSGDLVTRVLYTLALTPETGRYSGQRPTPPS